MTKRPSIIYETCTRFDQLKAIGQSRHAAKRLLRRSAARKGVALSIVTCDNLWNGNAR